MKNVRVSASLRWTSVSFFLSFVQRSHQTEPHKRNYADNIGIAFHTPEEFFLKAPVKSYQQIFDPKIFLQQAGLLSSSSPSDGKMCLFARLIRAALTASAAVRMAAVVVAEGIEGL